MHGADQKPQCHKCHMHVPQDPFAKNKVVGRPTNTLTRRPDSKDISSRYPTLPPLKSIVWGTTTFPRSSSPRPGHSSIVAARTTTPSPRPFNSSEDSRTNGIRPLYDPAGSGAYSHRNFQSQPAQNGMKICMEAGGRSRRLARRSLWRN